jgi:hypothetical protein
LIFSFFHFPQSQQTMLTMFILLNRRKPYVPHAWTPDDRYNPWPGPICIHVDHPDPPFPLSHNWCMLRTAPSPFPFCGLLLKGTHARDFIVRFFTMFWHHSIINNAEVKNFKIFVKLSVKSSYKMGFSQIPVIAKNAPFHFAFSAKTLCFTLCIHGKRMILLLLWLRLILPKAHSFAPHFRQQQLV